MIEVLTPIRTSTCTNCGEKITLFRSDLRTDDYGWSHDETGQRYCAHAPLAEPQP